MVRCKTAPWGSTYTIRELCRRMMAESDNLAGNMMLKRIGFEEVNATAEWLGTPDQGGTPVS